MRDRRRSQRANLRGEPSSWVGPQTLSYDDIVRVALRSSGRRRRLLHVPLPVTRAALRALRRAIGPHVFVTWEEAELMEEPMVASHRRRRGARRATHADGVGARPG